MWSAFRQVVETHQRFLLASHVNPDADGIGSEVALASFLHSLGKTTVIVNPSVMPTPYKFLDPKGEILVYDERVERDILPAIEVAIIIDVGTLTRLTALGEALQRRRPILANIDHHLGNERFADVLILDEDAPASGVLIYDFIRFMGATPTVDQAQAMYTAVLRETGGVRFSNTTQRAFAVAEALVELGVQPHLVYRQVYERSSLDRMRLLGHVLTTLTAEGGGDVVWMKVTQEDLRTYEVGEEELDGFIDTARHVDAAEVYVFFVEQGPARTRISFRSRGLVDVNALAGVFGGGGHRNASGATLLHDLTAAVPRVLNETVRHVAAATGPRPTDARRVAP